MHPHLHTKDNIGCEEVMAQLEECHAGGFLYRCMGMCNDVKTKLNKCLAAERRERTKENRERARAERAKIEARWAEIDSNS
ncbi:MAG: hypothetical protein M1823_001143 [Watsoniomyces obsoletus]|nr:MAG: hypothetical protein M1823_001143 [Watsoniomyces obsoletus]